MFENLDVFKTAAAMARQAGVRQAVTARNIANSDTPGFRAQSMASFAETYEASARGITALKTRPGHMAGETAFQVPRATDTQSEPSPNGNSVSLEEEMVRAVDIEREHQRAIAIYKHGLTVLRTVLGR